MRHIIARHRRHVHLDVIPYATLQKWTGLTPHQRSTLLSIAGDTLGLLLSDLPIQVLILNGRSVVEMFQDIAGNPIGKEKIANMVAA